MLCKGVMNFLFEQQLPSSLGQISVIVSWKKFKHGIHVPSLILIRAMSRLLAGTTFYLYPQACDF